MKTFSTLIILLVLLGSCKTNNNTIEVTGQASMKIVPDMVELSLKAYNLKPAMKDAVNQTQLNVTEMLAVCRKYIRNENDIKVSYIATDKAFDYRFNEPRFIGYSAQQVLQVTLRNIDSLEKFTEELLATKVHSIDNIQYNHSKSDSIQRAVNLLALSDAKKTAENMCTQMNVKMGEIIYLSNYAAGSGNTPMHQASPEYNINLYNKGFGGRSFKMTTEILEFGNVAFAAFAIVR